MFSEIQTAGVEFKHVYIPIHLQNAVRAFKSLTDRWSRVDTHTHQLLLVVFSLSLSLSLSLFIPLSLSLPLCVFLTLSRFLSQPCPFHLIKMSPLPAHLTSHLNNSPKVNQSPRKGKSKQQKSTNHTSGYINVGCVFLCTENAWLFFQSETCRRR